MNNTTTYQRSMFGLTEINADTINANNLVLSGPLQVNSITSTAAGQSLSIDALGTGTLSLKSGGVTKISASNTATNFYSNTVNIREGKTLSFYDSSNTLKGAINAVSFGQIYNTAGGVLAYFQVGGSNRLILGLGANQLLVPTTIATEIVGSNNTRVANTAFVTTATLGLTGITYSDVGSIDMTTIDNNVTISVGKILSIPNHSNVETELTYISETISAMSYIDLDYTTFFASQVVVDNIFSIPSYANVKTTLDNLSVAAAGVAGISYSDVGGIDMTTIANNVTISATKKLSIPSYPDVESTLTTLTTSLTGITYDNTAGIDMTNIDNNVSIRSGKTLNFYDSVGTLRGYQSGSGFGQIYNSNNTLHYFQISGANKLILGLGTNQLLVPTTIATEAVGSNNTRVANTAFVTTATLGLTGITYSDVGSIDMTTITNNVTIGAGKTLSIPNFSNVETTLTTLTTNATGITYSAPYPLFIPQTTIAHDLYLATNKKLICDESWTKLYTTHDLTDSVGVGYFKGFMYNNGSVFTLSTVNPVNVYDGTSSEIVLKCGTQETIFGLDGMSLNWGVITLCTDIQLPTYTSLTGTLDTINNTLNQLSARVYEDDFLDGFNNSPIPWTSTGTGSVAQIADESGYQGMVRMTASNDRILYPTSANTIFYWTGLNRMDFFIRVNFTNDLVTYNVGLSDNNVGTGNTIMWQYQNTSPFDWSLRVNGLLVSGASSAMTALTGEWLYGSLINTKVGARTLRAYLKNMNSGATFDTNFGTIAGISTTADYRPYFRVTNTSGTGTKSMDIDYVSVDYAAVRPITPT